MAIMLKYVFIKAVQYYWYYPVLWYHVGIDDQNFGIEDIDYVAISWWKILNMYVDQIALQKFQDSHHDYGVIENYIRVWT